MKFPERLAVAREGAIKTYNGKSLVLHPDSPQKTSLPRVLRRSYIKYKCADFTQEVTPHVGKDIIARVQTICVGIDHLQKTLRQIIYADTKKTIYVGKCLAHSIIFSSVDRFKIKTFGEIRATHKVAITIRFPTFIVGLFIAHPLNISLHQGRILANSFDLLILTLNNFIDDLTEDIEWLFLLRRSWRTHYHHQKQTYDHSAHDFIPPGPHRENYTSPRVVPASGRPERKNIKLLKTGELGF